MSVEQINADGNLRHLITLADLDRSQIEHILEQAMRYRTRPGEAPPRDTILRGQTVANLFFEPSTRTRISFGSAFNLLGGHVSETTDIKASSLVKGESLRDTARVLSGFGDVIVMRHPQAGSVAEFASASRVPVINGGTGREVIRDPGWIVE